MTPRGAGPDLRAVLHHQAARIRLGAGAGHRLRHRPPERRRGGRGQRARAKGRPSPSTCRSSRRAPEAEPPEPEEPPEESTVPRGAETILVVEDDELVRGITVRALRALGYRILLAEDGEDALQVVDGHSGRIDLVVTDVAMPRMGGLELAERLIGRATRAEGAVRVRLRRGRTARAGGPGATTTPSWTSRSPHRCWRASCARCWIPRPSSHVSCEIGSTPPAKITRRGCCLDPPRRVPAVYEPTLSRRLLSRLSRRLMARDPVSPSIRRSLLAVPCFCLWTFLGSFLGLAVTSNQARAQQGTGRHPGRGDGRQQQGPGRGRGRDRDLARLQGGEIGGDRRQRLLPGVRTCRPASTACASIATDTCRTPATGSPCAATSPCG